MCVSTEDVRRNNRIERALHVEWMEFQRTIRVLVCGDEYSGKGQVWNTLKMVYNDGFRTGELGGFIPIIHYTILSITQRLINQANVFNYPLLLENIETARVISQTSPEGCVIFPLKLGIQNLWKDPSIQKTFEGISHELPESTVYFMGELERILHKDFIPITEDVCQPMLRKNTPIIDMTMNIGTSRYEFIDISNITALKRKWLHFFEGASLLAFVVSLAEYDHINEDGTNRMQESIKRLQELMSSLWLYQANFLVLFSKTDLFAEKIKKVPLSVCFPEYTGGENYERAEVYTRNKFMEARTDPRQTISTHFFGKELPSQIQIPNVIMSAVRDSVLNKVLIDAKIIALPRHKGEDE